jgi:hypothetical protein
LAGSNAVLADCCLGLLTGWLGRICWRGLLVKPVGMLGLLAGWASYLVGLAGSLDLLDVWLYLPDSCRSGSASRITGIAGSSLDG